MHEYQSGFDAEGSPQMPHNKGSQPSTGMQGGTALHFAAGMGHTEFAQTLLDSAPNPRVLLQAEDTNGLTPLMLAELRGHENMVHLLEGAIAKEAM